ncbi:MAG: hypothetical protein RL701_6679 [Pseudomonadota bacterium]|jgi:membrane fusion protein (multidrug efflux system)
MPYAFSRSLRAATADASGSTGVCIGTALLLLWLGWSLWSRMTVYEVSAGARIEYVQTARPMAAAISGRVSFERLSLGQRVEAHDVLVELDSSIDERRLAEEAARAAALEPERQALLQQIESERKHLEATRQAGQDAVAEANAQLARSQSQERYSLLRRESLSRTDGAVAKLELLRMQAEHEQAQAQVQSAGAHLQRALRELQASESAALARMAELTRTLTQIDGERARSAATLALIREQIEQHKIRAPLTGLLGEISALRPGAVVQPGERVATVLPSGELHIVAQFDPARVAGKVQRGQRARLRLDSFPSTQYGSLPAEVVSVAREVRDGRLRVELALLTHPTTIPVQHGLTGEVEVEIEQLAPAQLVMRSAGRRLTRP